jgi:Ca-activated chloride channel family protein
MPGEVQLAVQINKTMFPATGGQQLVYVLIEAMPTGAIANVQMPLNFGLVLDHSGSMSGRKLASLKEAAKLAIDRMGSQDLASVIIFDDKVKVIAPSQPVTDSARCHAACARGWRNCGRAWGPTGSAVCSS